MKHWNGKEENIYANAESGIICHRINPAHPMRWSLPSIGEAITQALITTYEICQEHGGKHDKGRMAFEKEMAEYGSD